MICKAFGNWRTALGAKGGAVYLANSAFVYNGTQLMPLVLFSVPLLLPSLSVGVPQFTQGNRAWALTPDRAGQTYPGIVVVPWQITVSTKVNLSGWLVKTAWDCECSQNDHFKTDNCFVFPLFSVPGRCLPLPSPVSLAHPWGMLSTDGIFKESGLF